MTRHSLTKFHRLYYQCHFAEVLQGIGELPTESLTPEILLIKANTLFELNRLEEAREALAASAQQDRDSDVQLHALARMSYMAKGYEEAREIWHSLYEQTSSEHYKFVALLGIANSLYDERDETLLPSLIEELDTETEQFVRPDDEICLHHLLGNYALTFLEDFNAARKHYEKALSIAAKHNWNYFMIRSFFGMALIAREEEKFNELKWTLRILENFVDMSEANYLNCIIKDEFSNQFAANSPVEFDRENMRLMVKDSWITLSERPKLYEFLEFLHIQGSYVEKRQIATRLWPAEDYKPRVHDPRIFDIAKRVRNLLTKTDAATQVLLLSGRRGYKLSMAANA